MLNTVDRFKRKITNLKVRSFSHQLLGYLDLYLNRNETIVRVGKNELNLTWKNRVLNIELTKNGMSYEFINDDEVIRGRYVKCKSGFYVILTNKESTIYDLDAITSYDMKTKTTFKFFDKSGVERFRRTSTEVDNYSKDKSTGEITRKEPDIMENYTEHCYQWRLEGKYILQRRIKKYFYPDGTKAFIDIKSSDDCHVRYKTVDELTKEIPDYGEYYGIDKEVFFKYFQGDATFDDVIQNFRSKGYVIRPMIEI